MLDTEGGCDCSAVAMVASSKRIAQTGNPVGVGGTILLGGFAGLSSDMCRVPRLARRLPGNLSTQRLTIAVGHNRHGVGSRSEVESQNPIAREFPFSRTGVPARSRRNIPSRVK